MYIYIIYIYIYIYIGTPIIANCHYTVFHSFYFLLNRFINRVINVISPVIYYVIFSIHHITFRRH